MKRALAITPATKFLDASGVKYTLHKFSNTVDRDYGQETSQKLNVPPRQVWKTIVFTDSITFSVAVAPVDREISAKSIARALGVRAVELADKFDAQRVTGYVIGGISPFGQKKTLTTVVDESAWDFDTIYVSGGRRGLEVEITPEDFIQVLNAIRAPISVRSPS